MLKSNRLTLRELTSSDLDTVDELLSLPETDEFNTMGIPETKAVTQTYLDEWLASEIQETRISYAFAVVKSEDQTFIGLMGLKLGKPNYRIAEVWFKTHKNYWRNGYSSEALARLLDFGFAHLNLHRIEAGCAVENTTSYKTLEEVGMTREGRKRKKLPIRGEWKDNYFYGILEEEFTKAK